MVLTGKISEEAIQDALAALQEKMEQYNRMHEHKLSLASGYALAQKTEDASFKSLFRQADAMMYENKRKIHQNTVKQHSDNARTTDSDNS